MQTKPSSFQWAYNGEALRPDPVMTRQRIASMIRAWRQHGYKVTRLHQGVTVRVGSLIATSIWSK